MRFFLTSLSLVFFLIFSLMGSAHAKVHRIMLMGDSITEGKGSSDLKGYRDGLYHRLEDHGFNHTYVGSKGSRPYQGHFKSAAVIRDFYHSSGEMYVKYEMRLHKPTIITLHLGTNNILNDENGYAPTVAPYSQDGGQSFAGSASGELARLIALLAQWHTGEENTCLETIFVCQIIPKKHTYNASIIEYNAAIKNMVDDAENGQISSIPPGLLRLVDQHSSFNKETMFVSDPNDTAHPNDTGYRNMVNVFADSFRTLPWRIAAGGGDLQHAFPGSLLPDSVTAVVTNDYGRPAAGIPVTFDLVQGDAQILSPTSVVTDALGRASIQVKLEFSDTSKITAYASDLVDSMYTFKVMTTPLKITASSGSQQHSLPLQTYDSPLMVRVEDVYSEPVTNTAMAWQVLEGDAVLHQAVTHTDALGQATVLCQAGWADSSVIEATFADMSGERTRFVLYSNPVKFTLAAGDSQQALPNTPIAQPLQVQVTDDQDTPLPGYSIQFATQTGDAVCAAPAVVTTNENGLASVSCVTGWAEESQITASLTGSSLPDLVFHLFLQKFLNASGQILYHGNPEKPVADLTVDIITDHSYTELTDEEGFFSTDSITRGQSIQIIPQLRNSSSFDPNTIMAYDAALIARHVVGIDSLNAIQQAAADVNQDTLLNIQDAMGVLRYVVGLRDTSNHRTGEWLFDPSVMTFDSLETNHHNLHFNATWIGDVHGGYDDSKTEETLTLESVGLAKNNFSDTTAIGVDMRGTNILSCSFKIIYDTESAVFQGIRKMNVSLTAMSHESEKGRVSIAACTAQPFEDTTPFALLFTVKDSHWSGPELKEITLNGKRSEAVNITAVQAVSLPQTTCLHPNFPNPFNENTMIAFTLKEQAQTTVRIYDILGRRVTTLISKTMPQGSHQLSWDGCNQQGQLVPSGIYIIELNHGADRWIQKIEKLR